MKSLDTNIVVRLIIHDDARQYALASALLGGNCFVSLTVLIEAEWVLRSVYGLKRTVIARMLSAVLSGPTVRTSAEEQVAWALKRYATGADLADMIHIVASPRETSFATFDAKLRRKAGDGCPIWVEHLR